MTQPMTPDQSAAALKRPCPVCYAPEGKLCHRSVPGDTTAFPVQLPWPFRWWAGPRWVHLHTLRLAG